MARDAGDGNRRVDGWFSEKVQAQLGILAVPVEQRTVDRLGYSRSRVRAHLPTALPRVSEHPRRDEEPERCLKWKYSANGAEYESQGQARSASPLVKTTNRFQPEGA